MTNIGPQHVVNCDEFTGIINKVVPAVWKDVVALPTEEFLKEVVGNIAEVLTLSTPDGPCGPMTNTVKVNFSGGKVQNIVHVLRTVFYNSLHFHLLYLTMLHPEKRRFTWVSVEHS